MKHFDKIHLSELDSYPMPMKLRRAIKEDLFAADWRREKIDCLGDPFLAFEEHIDFVALATEIDRLAPRPESLQGGRPSVIPHRDDGAHFVFEAVQQPLG